MKKYLLIFLLIASIAFAADTTYQAGVYKKQGGNTFVVASGGDIAVESGGILNIESGGLLKIAGTQITPTAAQFNFLAGVTAGTSAASKAVVLGSNSKIDALDITSLRINGGLVTPTALQLSWVDVTTAGTAQASKAAILGANKNLDEFHTAALYLGAAAGTLVTATAANLNAIPTATGTGTEIDAMTKDVYSSASTMVLAGAGTTVETVTITLKDADGNAIAAGQHIKVYISDDAAGITPASTGANGAVSFTTGGLLKEITAKLHWEVITDANGVAVLSIDNTGGGGAYAKYVVLVLPNGKLKVSAVLNVTQA